MEKYTLDVIREQVESDDELAEKQEDYIQRAYAESDIDGFLIALCGWSWESIQEMRKGK